MNYNYILDWEPNSTYRSVSQTVNYFEEEKSLEVLLTIPGEKAGLRMISGRLKWDIGLISN